MQRFDDNETGYTATAKTLSFTPIATTAATGSTTSAIKVTSTTGFTSGMDIGVGNDPVNSGDPLPLIGNISSVSSGTLNLTTPIASAPSAGVAVRRVFLYDIDKIDNPCRDKINNAAVMTNIRGYQMYGTL